MSVTLAEVSRPLSATAPAKPVRIFVIDDDEVMLMSCRRVLECDGYDIETFDTGQEGIARLAHVRPQLLLVDLKMPEFDGLQVIERVRAIDPELVIAVITGYATIETAVDAMKAGAYDFLPKPFTPDELRVVVRRCAERWQLASESRRLREEKDAAERRVFTFLSHQLKSPLAAARQCLDVLMFTSGDDLPGRAAEWIDRTRERLDEMLSLINDWLTLARAERTTPSAGGRSDCLATVIDDVVRAAAGHAAHANVRITTELDAAIPPVVGEPVTIATVLSNLVINGITYNRDGGEVRIRAVPDGETVRIEVSDTGCGIPCECLPHIFEEFYRVGGQSSGIPGTGLGLAICRRIVHDLGGSIDVASTVGAGSVFTVRLPLTRQLEGGPA